MQSAISKNKISRYTALQQKKYRKLHQEFVVEGKKGVEEFIRSGFKVIDLVVVDGNQDVAYLAPNEFLRITEKDMKKLSSLNAAPGVFGVFAIPEEHLSEDWKDGFSLVLDGVRDPGNMGTILRTADWFGVKNIFCSEDCVDIYNPKVVQATMGSLSRVSVVCIDLVALFEQNTFASDFLLMGAFMDGTPLSSFRFNGKGALVLGNESEGIRPALRGLINQKISIPRSANSQTESLNVAVAAAIFCHSLTGVCL